MRSFTLWCVGATRAPTPRGGGLYKSSQGGQVGAMRHTSCVGRIVFAVILLLLRVSGPAFAQTPVWNAHAKQFIWPPAFEITPVAGAKTYRFTVVSADGKTRTFEAA